MPLGICADKGFFHFLPYQFLIFAGMAVGVSPGFSAAIGAKGVQIEGRQIDAGLRRGFQQTHITGIAFLAEGDAVVKSRMAVAAGSALRSVP